MFERFTDTARRVVVRAQEEARQLNHNYIGTEHLLLGLVHLEDERLQPILSRFGFDLAKARALVEDIIGRGGNAPAGHIPFTPRAKKVLELAGFQERRNLGLTNVHPELILLGLIREGEGIGFKLIEKFEVDPQELRAATVAALTGVSDSDKDAWIVWSRADSTQNWEVAGFGPTESMAIAEARDADPGWERKVLAKGHFPWYGESE